MKKIILTTVIFLLYSVFAFAQQADYKVVFDITSNDSVNQRALIREMQLIKDGNPDAQIEAVIYGQGLSLIKKDEARYVDAINHLISEKDVSFKVCALAMKRQNVDKSQLLPGIEIVPDGIYEIISKQHDGWGYIKIAH